MDVRGRCQPEDDDFHRCPAQAETLLFIIDCGIEGDLTSVHNAFSLSHALYIISCHVRRNPGWRCSASTLSRMLDIFKQENEQNFDPEEEEEEED